MLKRELGADVEMIHGRYGELKVLVDGNDVIDAGPLAALGIVPAGKKIVTAVRAALGSIRA